MDVNQSDRIGAIPRSGRASLLWLLLGGIVFCGFAAVAFLGGSFDGVKAELQAAGLVAKPDFMPLYGRLGVAPLSSTLEASGKVQSDLAKLTREPCDGRAATALADVVAKANEMRWAADAMVGWASRCGPDNAAQLRQAASFYVNVHDYDHAFSITKDLIDAHPHVADYQYLRAKAEVGLKHIDDALLSYANTIHLQTNPRQVGSWVFFEMSDLYAAAGHFCEAIGPIQDYVSLDPARRSTGNAQTLMQGYATKGHCNAFAAGAETYPVTDSNVIRARVMVNGIAGLFVVDTGASFVTVTAAFAQKARLDAGGGPKIRSDTANGEVYQRLTSAGSIKVGKVEAKQVPVAILDHSLGAADGLLGRSFLSRFDVTIASDHWTLRSKTNGPPT